MKHHLKGGVGAAFRRNYAALITKRYGNVSSQLKVVAIVGAHGKTTTANYLQELLAENQQSTGLLDSSPHTPLSVRRTQLFLRKARKEGVNVAIVVLGVQDIRHHVLGSVPLEAVVVTDSNTEILPSIKSLLETRPKYIVLNRDDEHYDVLSEQEATAQTISFGKHQEADARIAKTKLFRRGSELQLIVDHQTKLNLATYLIGESNLYNLAAAVTTLYVMGENIHTVDEGAARLEELPANYEYLHIPRPYSLVLDRAPDKRALDLVVETAKSLTQRRLIVATELDIVSEELIESIAGIADRLIVIDINDYVPNRGTIERVVSPDAAVKLALRTARQGDTVLFAGPVFAQRHEDGRSFVDVTIGNME